ncbi:hypothetical protein GCM10010245_91480 [Streptomyces spectabilis]|nr:hypothetical protein [Streptomyces spectabilis]GGV58364.1 hypothetical protein GCM10010245_91480 [Streptomyces spectabilis]
MLVRKEDQHIVPGGALRPIALDLLAVEAYEQSGGIRGAIAQTAEDLYTRMTAAQATRAASSCD